jgi:AraC-like DNA-binding protein
MVWIVRSLAVSYYDQFHIEQHAHAWGQLIYAASGVMRVRCGDLLWLIPPAQAVWAPAGVRHEIWARAQFAMRTLYFEPRFSRVLPRDCRALDVSPLLRALILRIVAEGMLDSNRARQRRLALCGIDEIVAADVSPLSLPLPVDARAVRVADFLREDPASRAELSELAQLAGASGRTLQRLFIEGTGLRFSEWRQRLRLIHAAALLAAGASVMDAALEAGYASSSAFSAAFRGRFGCPPTQLQRPATTI